MGSSDERNTKAIDASVGGLVWVRRRNGSWWPGRIMAHHEVPENSVVSPKSGTPIKLLGRDDASVDWYNLEKSKRVKAFRCGEYDACIETAKATASATSKKAVKYARREDAIVHALEIENAHLAKDSPELLQGKDDSCTEKTSISGEDPKGCLSSKGNEDLTDVAKTEDALQSIISFKKPSYGKVSKVQPLSEKRRRTPNDSEDDGTEGNKRMRGLEDIGMDIGSEKKLQVGALPEAKQENHNDVVKNEGSNGSACRSPAATLINGIEKSTSKWQLKGKRNSRQMSKKQEERRNAYAEEANNNSLPHCSVSDQKPHGHFSVGTQAMGRNSQRYDVKIEVKANYKPRNVPLISLRSKLNGEAIVGHPLTVEVVEDGSCDHIVSSHIKSRGVPMADDANIFLNIPPKPLSKKKPKKREPHSPPYKSKSKKSSSLSKKTRCLSALSGQKLTVISKKKVMTEKAKEQVVACIPLKVVFSRINEAVKGSVRPAHRALPSAGNT